MNFKENEREKKIEITKETARKIVEGSITLLSISFKT